MIVDPPIRSLSTDRLALEPQTAAHADEMFPLLCDPAIYEYENDPPASVEWLRERFTKLESRRSPDGEEQWLNWVVHLPTGELAGYVQATVHDNGNAGIAYVLGSDHWGKGIARNAVEAMIVELVERYGVHTLVAVLKRDNRRSARLLDALGFYPAPGEGTAHHVLEPDEIVMYRAA